VSRTRAILASRNLPILRRAARARLLLAFDFDGTLSPIAPTPEAARLPATTRRLLKKAAARYPSAVISGRALADIEARMHGLGIRYLFGNHGLETSLSTSAPHPQVDRWLPTLERELAGHKGIVIENKRHSVAVHFRSAPDHARALAIVNPIVERLPHVRIVHGLASVNLLPRAGVNKGTALRRALTVSGCRIALYIGDDITDEDAFGALGEEKLIAIRIGRSSTTRARFHIASREAIDELLTILIALREEPAARS